MSGVSDVRGGFDSHAFPPIFAAMRAAALAAAPDSLAAPPAGIQVVGGTRARADTTRAPAWYNQPRFVMARSLVFPGWGQMHNHAWLKAALVAGGEGWLGVRILDDQRALDDLLRELDKARAESRQADEVRLVNEYNDRLSQRLGRQWLLGAVLAYALVDAYVDAHFRGFELEFQMDPALPAGPPATPASGGGAQGMRLALRRDF